MANYSLLSMLNEDPLLKDPTLTKVSTIPKSTGADPARLDSLEIYTDNETKGIEYSVLCCPSVFTQTLGGMCLDTEMMRPYKHFVLHGSILLSEYWREACSEHKHQKEGNIWFDGSFTIIMKEFKNQVLSSEHAAAAGDAFCINLQRALKKPDDMILKAFKTPFKVVFKLYDNLKATLCDFHSHLLC